MKIAVYTMPNCQPCEELARHWARLKPEFPWVSFDFVDLLANPTSAASYRILASPALVVDGKLLHQGGLSQKELHKLLAHLTTEALRNDAFAHGQGAGASTQLAAPCIRSEAPPHCAEHS